MIYDQDNVWSGESTSSYQKLAGVACNAPYLTAVQKRRLERIRQARMLTDRQYEYFMVEGRTQYTPPKMKLNDAIVEYYAPLNLLKLMAYKSADLLYGSDPIIKAGDESLAESLESLMTRSHLSSLLVESEVDCGSTGESILLVCRHGYEVYLTVQPPECFHPEGRLLPNRQYASYVYYAEENIGTEQSPDWILLQQRYTAGAIETHVYQLGADKAKGAELPLDKWPAFADGAPQPVEKTGLEENLIIWIPNMLRNRVPISDFDGLVGLQDKINFKSSQLDVVIVKHGTPRIAVPQPTNDGTGNVNQSHEVFYFRSKEEIPQYIVWNAEIGSAVLERDNAIDHFCMVAETSPEILGIRKGGAPDSAKALRLRATNALAKAARKATVRSPLIGQALAIAQKLEKATPGSAIIADVLPPSVRIRDGLPIDESETASIVNQYRASESMSLEDAVAARIPNPDAAAAEVARIKAQLAAKAKAATPSIFMSGQSEDSAATTADAGTEAA